MSNVITFDLDGITRDLDLSTLLISESIEMQKLIGITTMRQLLEGLRAEDPQAVKFVWWLVNKRAGTPVECTFAELDFNFEDFGVIPPPAPDADESTPEEGVDDDTPTSSDPDTPEAETGT